MSIWIPRRDSTGRFHMYSISVPLLCMPAAVGILVAVLLGMAATAPLESVAISGSATLLGFTLFLLAKISVYQSGIWLSFGSRRMTSHMRCCYRVGYGLMISGAIVTLLLIGLVMGIHG